MPVLTALRRQIIAGDLSPGDKIPTCDQLHRQMGVSKMTVHRVFDQLARDGFLTSQGSRGTFVSERPPHLHRYGLIFPYRPSGVNVWSRFYTALAGEARKIETERNLKLPFFYDTMSHVDEHGDYARLIQSVQSHCLAGLIFGAQPGQLQGTPVMQEAGLPRVAVMHPSTVLSGVSSVYPDLRGFYARALEWLASRGRQRVAVISVGYYYNDRQFITEQATKFGMMTGPQWIHKILTGDGEAGALARLLMHGRAEDRPDGLIIADDNLVEDTTAGIAAAGVRAPEELDIIAHTNFPNPPSSSLPLKRLGFDARQVLEACIERIGQQRQTKKELKPVLLPALFEEEIGQRTAVMAERHASVLEGHTASPI